MYYKKIFIAARILNIVKDLICSSFDKGTIFQSNSQYILFSEMLLQEKNAFTLLESLKGVDAEIARLHIFYSDDVRLYTAIKDKHRISTDQRVPFWRTQLSQLSLKHRVEVFRVAGEYVCQPTYGVL